MRIYVLNPPFFKNYVRCGRWQGVAARGGTLYYPIWLAYAAASLEQAGHQVRFIDAVANKWSITGVIEDANTFQPELLICDTNFASITNDVEIAVRIKKETKACAVMVGQPVALYAEKMLTMGADVVARFEYDFTVCELATVLANGTDLESVRGIAFLKENNIITTPDREFADTAQLDALPFVSRVYKEHLNIKAYFLGHSLYPTLQIFTGRGCPFLCSFCSWPQNLMGHGYRARSISNVLDEFAYICEQLPEVKEIFIEDDTFTTNKKRVLEFCSGIKSRKIKIPWSCNARATLDFETMKAMKEAGCRLLDVGFESGNDTILKNIKKGITTKESKEFAKNAKKAGLMVLGDFVFGFPGENKKTAAKTMEFVREIKPDLVQYAMATPLPGTPFHQWCKENGFLFTNDLEESIDENGFQKSIVSYPDFTWQDIQYYVNTGLKKYYINPSYLLITIKNCLKPGGLQELRIVTRSAVSFLKYLFQIKRKS